MLSKKLNNISKIVIATGIGINLNISCLPDVKISNNGIIYYYVNNKETILYDGELRLNDRKVLIQLTKVIAQFDRLYLEKLEDIVR